MKIKVIRITAIFTILMGFHSCEQPSEFKRDNQKDPTNSAFDPEPPRRVEVEKIDKMNNIVQISWKDDSQGIIHSLFKKR